MNDFIERYYTKRSSLQAGSLGERLYYLDECDSTNDIARELAEKQESEGALIAAGYQRAGRGRLERHWLSGVNSDILASLLLYPDGTPADSFFEIASLALGIAEAIEAVCPLEASVKWPNDILINGKKIAGILPESAFSGDTMEWMIIGFGVNVGSIFSDEDPLSQTSTSIAANGFLVHPADLLAEIVAKTHINRSYRSPDELRALMKKRMTMLGEEVWINQGGKVLAGIAVDLTHQGELVISTGGKISTISFGDATIVK